MIALDSKIHFAFNKAYHNEAGERLKLILVDHGLDYPNIFINTDNIPYAINDQGECSDKKPTHSIKIETTFDRIVKTTRRFISQ